MDGPFYLIFNDVEKADYPDIFEQAIPRLRIGGLLVTDNGLWSGRVADRGVDDADTRGVREHNRTRLFPGVAETLDRLPVRLAVVTNKPEAPARAILEGLGVLRRFGAVVGGDSLPVRKPDPGPLLHVAGRFGVAPARALMVGDTRTDLDAARAAGMRSCAARYGFAYQEDLSVADFGIDAFAELGLIVLG